MAVVCIAGAGGDWKCCGGIAATDVWKASGCVHWRHQ